MLTPYQEALKYQQKLDESRDDYSSLPTPEEFINMSGVNLNQPEEVESMSGKCREFLYAVEGLTGRQRQLLNQTLRILQTNL